jgi:hypothetical protein
VRFEERKEWLYDPQLFRQSDTQTALKIHAEYVKKFSPYPYPKFYEVNRSSSHYDELWHVPLNSGTIFSRVIDLPVIIQAERPDWRLTRAGLIPHQKYKVWMANLWLQETNWFPMRGDFMQYNGYRNTIINVVLEPNFYWQQTNVWLGLICETAILPDGDARPLINPTETAPSEHS